LHGQKDEVLQRWEQALISESLARQLFGDLDNEMPEIYIESRRLPNDAVFVSGIFKDIPETSHFHTDILMLLPDESEVFAYV
jgi:putative ABC transport system permease protein